MTTAKREQADRIGVLMHEVERTAKRLRADFRKRARAVHVPKEIRAGAAELRKLAVRTAFLIEKYAHGLRTELERAGAPRRTVRAARRW